MNNPDYLKAINENLGVFRNTVIGKTLFSHSDDLKMQIIDFPQGINVLGEEIILVDENIEKESYDEGDGFVVFDLGDKTLKLDYGYSSWDDPTIRDLYYVEKVVKEVVTLHTYYSRAD